MEQVTGFGALSALLAVPILGAIVISLIPETFGKAIKGVAMLFTLVSFAMSLAILGSFQGTTYHFQMVEFVPWIDSLGIHYRVGVDGLSIWMLVLTNFLMVVSVWFSFYVNHRIKAYFAFLLLLQTAMLGVFVALDLILFYTFFEASLIPMAVMIWIWGGSNRNYAALKFFIYTFAASIFMLVGMIVIAQLHRQATGVLTFDLIAIQSAVADGSLWAGALQLQAWIFWAFALAFMVKCPMFPFHTWLPDAHTEAPTAGSIILAGVLLKMGTYGFLRFLLPLFPDVIGQNVPILMGLAVVGILYGAAVAAVQPDLKKLIAYSSVAHMGFVVIGIFSLTHSGIMGGTYQQLNHGISTGGLFLLVGLLYERIHTRLFKDMGGLKAQMPVFSALFLIIMLSSVGLPGLNGFVGEFLALLGAFQSSYLQLYGLNVWFAVLAASGVIFAAVYLLWMFQKVFYGPNANPTNHRLKDLKTHEVVLVGTLVVLAFWGGLYPKTFLQPMEAAVGAVRMMAINPVGQRPTWDDLTLEVDSGGNLVRVVDRERNGNLGNYVVLERVAPANLYPSSPSASVEARGLAGAQASLEREEAVTR